MHLIIPGPPVPQIRMRTSSRGGFVRHYDPKAKEKKVIRESITQSLRDKYPDLVYPEYPRISFIFHMPIPKSIRKKDAIKYNSGLLKHVVKPDCDNLAKLYLDCMDQLIFDGDQQVSLGFVIKLYHPQPKTIIFIEETKPLLDPHEVDLQIWRYLFSPKSDTQMCSSKDCQLDSYSPLH